MDAARSGTIGNINARILAPMGTKGETCSYGVRFDTKSPIWIYQLQTGTITEPSKPTKQLYCRI